MKKLKVSEILTQAANLCLHCYQPPCTAACPQGCDPAQMLFSLRMQNPSAAVLLAQTVDVESVEKCPAPCMQVCIHRRMGAPIAVKAAHLALCREEVQG